MITIRKSRKSRKRKSTISDIIIGLILILVLIGASNPNLYANKTMDGIQLVDCVDGDTAKLQIDGKNETVRFLAIDTPETKHPQKGIEPYGKEASDFTCTFLKNGSEIKLEYDSNSEDRDKYDRVLAWVFIDGKLLQEELIKQGYAKVAYIYGDYSYLDRLYNAEQFAQVNSIGIWK